eukprot:CAMPEP_0201177568 /NCGR_PEP_ID=MMETSP0851-20130426/107981_1 /ASSEMBLY_ACC=CAM_ASM_000631 /TAXON_ID=183588 /ORGANISM="Pseudo-nitzschia fraudulenta, Strain WWA7" /LENGTH=82 /DNA_ID=CAMNT_0047461195 /DNA_START=47 /DNA_END=292 /DNA_ORIENTATION=+
MASSVFRYFDQHDAVDNGLKKDSRSSAGINAPVKNEGDLLEKKTDPTTRSAYEFTPKFQHSTKNNPMCGICFPQWMSILRNR